MTLPVAILAGGLATRLGALTKQTPKALLDVAGKPFILHQLARLRAAGIERVVLCVAHLAEQIEEVVGDGRAFGLDVRYSHDGGKLVGTGGAIRQALPLLGDRFLIMYGDSYLRCDYAAIASAFVASGKLGMMTVFHNQGRYERGNIDFQSGRIVRYDKTAEGLQYIDYGLGGCTAAAFAGHTAEPLDLVAVFQDLLRRDQLFAYEVHERFYEIGSVSGLEETRALLQETT